MDAGGFFVVGGIVAAGLLLFFGVLYLWFMIHERFFLDAEERWRRRYDRRLKKHFKSIDGM